MRFGQPGMLAALLLLPAWPATADTPASPLSAWRVSLDAVGPIRLGMTLAQARKAAGMALTEQPLRGDAAAWRACHYAWPTAGGQLRLDLGLMLEQDVVTRIDIATPDVATRSGARVGDPEDSVTARYAGHLQVAADGAAHYLIVYPDQPRQMIFQAEEGKVTAYRIGQLPAVHYSEGCT
jgi:hypothetical protein